ncbi:TIGR04283 family arsenosugar biosynthesis glycosyltransferase [Oceanicella actignis]|uniref:Transferase 2, rSAM/selenodomain-associated n=1 Tax=Oceanicella actignis TaxID=1189325 RepID=A0A1M7T8F8_9RHOB|nr:TIGR04283 family arsenosugar biosynthesis glycosyltransferase [Oceanicella actignis]SET49638.1 transferase 2, rSAM/selenodomain-associated [Oceanicella actignis]SHN67025.1 transferase 2, rSAM/selenodomain-associated [Oceanicella actignis]
MPAPISVVIPTLNAAAGLGPTLASLTEGLREGLIAELVIADGGSEDDIAWLAEEIGARLVAAPRGRGRQLAAGAQAARGAWLLFLHADTVLDPGWSAAARRHMRAHPDAAGWFRLRFDAPGAAARWTAGWANLRARLFGLPYGDQGLLVRAQVYRAAGGHPPVALMEDVALARRLRMRPLDAGATTSAARYLRDGWLRRGWINLSTLALYLAGADPERLARRYERAGRRRLSRR